MIAAGAARLIRSATWSASDALVSRQQQRELLAAVASQDVALAELVAPGRTDLDQEAVAGLVAVRVVVALEVVEVEERDRGPASRGGGCVQRLRQLLVPGSPVGEAGEGIGERRSLEPLDEVASLDRNPGIGGKQARRVVDERTEFRRALQPADREHPNRLTVAADRLEEDRAGSEHVVDPS